MAAFLEITKSPNPAHRRWRAARYQPLAIGLVLIACGTTELEATRLVPGDAAAAADAGSPEAAADAWTETLQVSTGALRDHCGAPVLLRGVNELFLWGDAGDAALWISEIAQTGANALRVVWQREEAAADLDLILASIAGAGMVAVVEFHDQDEGVPEEVAMERMLDAWTGSELLQVLSTHERSILIELGTAGPSAEPSSWQETYTLGLARLRQAGLRLPVALRSPSWRGDLAASVAAQKAVIDSDPLSNSMVGFTYWRGDQGGLENYLRALDDAGIAAYVSEFSQFATITCPQEQTDVDEVLELTARYQVGWFAWSWGGVQNMVCPSGPMDMTSDGTLAGLLDWGRFVALEHPQGIASTSIALRTAELDACP